MSELSPEPGWQLDAPCREIGIEFFFGFDGETRGQKKERVPAAKRFCQNTCPVISECLLQALAEPEEFGVFGGTNQADRRAMLTGRTKLPEWADERHEEVVRLHRVEMGSLDTPAAPNGATVANFAASLAVKAARKRERIDRAMALTEAGYSVPAIAEMLETTERTITKYRAQAREMSAA